MKHGRHYHDEEDYQNSKNKHSYEHKYNQKNNYNYETDKDNIKVKHMKLVKQCEGQYRDYQEDDNYHIPSRRESKMKLIESDMTIKQLKNENDKMLKDIHKLKKQQAGMILEGKTNKVNVPCGSCTSFMPIHHCSSNEKEYIKQLEIENSKFGNKISSLKIEINSLLEQNKQINSSINKNYIKESEERIHKINESFYIEKNKNKKLNETNMNLEEKLKRSLADLENYKIKESQYINSLANEAKLESRTAFSENEKNFMEESLKKTEYNFKVIEASYIFVSPV